MATADFNTFIATVASSGLGNKTRSDPVFHLRSTDKCQIIITARWGKEGHSELHGVTIQKAGIFTATAT